MNEYRIERMNPARRSVCAVMAAGVLLALMHATALADAPEVTLADGGESHLDVIVAEGADESVHRAAEELADYLGRISGAAFEVRVGDGSGGIVVGVPDDFANLPFEQRFGTGAFERDHYLLRSTGDGLYLLGAAPLAVEFAVWDLLYRFGHRQFFPTDTWEIVPDEPRLAIAIDEQQVPDYFNRRGPRGGIRMDARPWALDNWQRWQARNRTASSFELRTGHAYDGIIRANRAAFDENPEYWGLVDGERTERAQPNVAHPDVQRMFVEHALRFFENNPDADSVALDPRDGNPWSQSDESRAIGRPSEQAVFIANVVAEAVVEAFGPDKYVGIYAYSHHSPAPTIDVHPNVIVSLATSFIRGGYTIERMLDEWSQRAELIGIREYYGLTIWSWGLPGRARATNTEYLQRTIPEFHAAGARFMNAESDDAWGPHGLGYYLASRMLWDVSEADRIDELIEDFLERSFGPAVEPMRAFYDLIDGRNATEPYGRRRSAEDMAGRMYRLLEEARELAADRPDVIARIDDLILFTRYVELYDEYATIRGPQRQAAFDALMTFSWRIRGRQMVESVGLRRGLNRYVRGDDDLEWPGGETINAPSDRHRENENVPLSETEILDILREGIANNQIFDLGIEPVRYSDDLAPAGIERGDAERGSARPVGHPNRGALYLSIWTDDGTLPHFTFSAGHIYDDRGPLRWALSDADGRALDRGEIAPEQTDQLVELDAPEPGLYRMEVTNTGQGYRWDYEPRGARVTLRADVEQSSLDGNWFDRLWFYVPDGVETIALAGTLREGRHSFFDGAGRQIDPESIEVEHGFTNIPVPEGQDGAVWSVALRSLRPDLRFLNTPGYVAFSPDELLLPTTKTQSHEGDHEGP